MKNTLKINALCIAMIVACVSAFAEGNSTPAQRAEQQKLSVSFDALNTSMLMSLNAEYSPNQYLDFGMGMSPSAFFFIPSVEVHAFARVCFLDYFIQPYLQLGISYVAPGQIDNNTNCFNARIGTGVKFTFAKNFYCGIGGGYCFVGQNLIVTPNWFGMDWHGFYPAAFVGYTALRF